MYANRKGDREGDQGANGESDPQTSTPRETPEPEIKVSPTVIKVWLGASYLIWPDATVPKSTDGDVTFPQRAKRWWQRLLHLRG